MEYKVVRVTGESALVEWLEEGRYKRAVLPKSEVSDGQCDAEALAQAVTYGVEWEKHIDLGGLDAEFLANELRRCGVWTLEDLRLKSVQAMKAFTRPFGRAFLRMMAEAEREK